MTSLAISSNAVGTEVKATTRARSPPLSDETLRRINSRFYADYSLRPGDMRVSMNGRYQLRNQDGNLVLSDTIPEVRTLWSSNLPGDRPRVVEMRPDGDLEIHNVSSQPIEWSSGTKGRGNKSSVLIVQNDGNVVIISDQKLIWQTRTRQKQRVSPSDEAKPLQANDSLGRDEAIISPNGRYRLLMQGDCNLVLYDLAKGNSVLWTTDTWYKGGTPEPLLRLGADGNLLLHDYLDVKWSSNTAGKGNSDAVLLVQDDADVVIRLGNKQIWTRRRTRLVAGETLEQDQSLISYAGRYLLTMQGDCNLVLYDLSDRKRVIWASGIVRDRPKPRMRLSTDGNLAVYDDNTQVWSSGTGGQGDGTSRLDLRDDGNVVLVSQGHIVWSNKKSLVSPPISSFKPVQSGVSQMRPGECLNVDSYLSSVNNQFVARLQADGNFALHHKNLSTPVWTSNTAPNNAVTKVVMQHDCNLVVLGAENKPVWSSGATSDDGDAVFTLSDDGNLSITDKKRRQIWSSNVRFPASTGKVDRLYQNEFLLFGQSLSSWDGKHQFTFTDAANFQVTSLGKSIYYYTSFGLSDAKMLYLASRDSGQSSVIVIRNSKGVDIWTGKSRQLSGPSIQREAVETWKQRRRQEGRSESSPTRTGEAPRPSDVSPPNLLMGNDGNLTVQYEQEGVWSLIECLKGLKPAPTDKLTTGQWLAAGDSLISKNFRYVCTYRTDGSLVVVRDRKWTIWSSMTMGASTGSVEHSASGSLRIRDIDMRIRWSSSVKDYGPPYEIADATTIMQDDGNLVTYMLGRPLWASEDR